MTLEDDLRHLGVLEKAVIIAAELGPEAAVRYVRSSYHLLSKVYHPDLHQTNRAAAEEGQRRLNLIKENLDRTSDDMLAGFLFGRVSDDQKARRRVLIVEDEESLRENLAYLLGLEGFEVRQAANGMAGLGEHLKFRPHLVIADVVMPIMDGVEMVTQMLKRDPHLRALFISGFFGTHSVQPQLLDRIEAMGFPTLPKPFRPSHLFDLVRSTLHPHPGPVPGHP